MNEWCDPHYGERKMWTCRLCGHYEQAMWSNSCAGCGVVFQDPQKFNLPSIKFKKIHPDAVIPTRATDGSVGYDLYAIDDFEIKPNETTVVKTGLSVELPPNVEMQVRPRSGLAKKGLIVLNSPGTVDPDYRGEIMVMMSYAFTILETVLVPDSTYVVNIGSGVFEKAWRIEKGERIAQALFTTKLPYKLEEVDDLSKTERGEGGFGSTGTK